VSKAEARQILIVEDEILLSMHLEDLLTGMGHRVVACVAHLQEALRAATQTNIDFAFLDINLGGDLSFPVAAILRRRNIPFVFATAYGIAGLSDEFRGTPILQKPYDPRELERVIAEACAIVG